MKIDTKPRSDSSNILKIHRSQNHTFNIRHDVVSYFYNKLHFHPEIELIYIIEGKGRQFIGESVFHFKEGDMLLVGANVPHLWRADERYFNKEANLTMQAYVMHFLPDCLGDYFLNLPENKGIRELIFNKAPLSVRIKDECKERVVELMQLLLTAADNRRIILLLEILNTIASHKKNIRTICENQVQFDNAKRDEGDKMNQIYQYILNNFHHEITLEQIAKIAHMTPNAFCRYFKSRIKKTFSGFLMEVRIGHAAKLLAETNKSVADICFESGFNNFSNFNRHFKLITHKTPLNHRKYYQELIAQRNFALKDQAFHPD